MGNRYVKNDVGAKMVAGEANICANHFEEMLKPFVVVDDYEVPELVLRILPSSAVKVMTKSEEEPAKVPLESAFGMTNADLKLAYSAYDRLREGERPITRKPATISFNPVVDENSVVKVSKNYCLIEIHDPI